jgi:hypothetical protein
MRVPYCGNIGQQIAHESIRSTRTDLIKECQSANLCIITEVLTLSNEQTNGAVAHKCSWQLDKLKQLAQPAIQEDLLCRLLQLVVNANLLIISAMAQSSNSARDGLVSGDVPPV